VDIAEIDVSTYCVRAGTPKKGAKAAAGASKTAKRMTRTCFIVAVVFILSQEGKGLRLKGRWGNYLSSIDEFKKGG
jgi:hypothetical protein